MRGYEVNLDLEAGIEAEYLDWLRAHVAEILALDGFVSASIRRVLDPPPAPGRAAYSVLYTLRDAAALQSYFDHHAARMREDGLRRFAGRFVASRRVLEAVDAA